MATISTPILDFMAKRGSENRVIDLDDVFSGEGLTYTVTSSDPSVADVTIDGSQMTIDFLDTLSETDLKITATDATGASVTDNVRLRVTGENAYTIAVLPDTQDYTNAARSHIFQNMTNWLVDNKDSLNIEFVIHVGDITTNNSDANHWPYAEEAIRILDGKIPYSLLPGNHDQNTGNAANHSTDPLDTRFSPDKQAATNPGTFGGVYDQEPTRSANNYHTFTAPDGTKWMVLSLEFGARDDVLRWAGEVIEEHLDHRVILANHSYMNWAGRHDATGAPLYDEGTGYDYGMGNSVEGANDGETMYRELIQKYPNVTFTFSGHIFGDGAETLVSYDQFGNPVYQMMVNYQNGVASEITSNGGMGSGGNGGNGAIRLLTIDPDNNSVYTSTYFTELDDYLDGGRGDGELDRDGLTGEYRGHEETLNLDLGTPDAVVIAKAGNDQFVTAEAGEDTALVTLDGDWTLNSGDDEDLVYSWTDRDGNVVATGATPTVELDAGHHRLTLTVTDSTGRATTDDVLVVVSNENTLLVDNFNDGNANGWTKPGPAIATQTGTASSFELPALPGGDATVSYIPKLTPTQGIRVAATEQLPAEVAVVKSYSLVYDLLIEPGVQSYFSFLQTDITNTSDQDIALRTRSATEGGIGINSDYEGTVTYGQWHRIAFTIQDQGTSSLITKYIDGVNVGTTVQSGGNHGRYAIDLNKGVLLFADESNETWPGYASSFLFTDKVYTDAEIAALGGPKAGGIVDTPPSERSVQVNFGTPNFTDDFGNATVTSGAVGSGNGSFIVKGTANSRDTVEDGQDALEGRVFEQSDSANNILVWNENGAKSWSNYEYEATLKSTDNDGLGVVFYYQNDQNHYRVVLDAETNTRQLVKVADGVQTVLASETGGTPWSRDFDIKVAVVDGEINVFLDGRNLFGTVVDTAPLAGGTVGFYSNGQRSSQFDNVAVNKVALTAHAGQDARIHDLDADGSVTVTLDAEGTYGLADIVSYVWTDADGNVVAQGKDAEAELGTGRQTLTLTVTDANGKTATDTMTVDAVARDKVLMSEDFGSEASLARWTIVDEGESGGVGPDGTASQWELQDGKYVQMSGLTSRQLTWNGASNSNPWQTGWSPLGDGVNVLRKGTYALYADPAAKDWSDYAVQTTIRTPDNGALGLLFYYEDENNYYKLELDANGDYDRSPGNGAGSLFQLIQVKDGVEKYLNQFPAKYTPGEDFDLRVEVKDGKIQAYVDGLPLFAYAIEDHAHSKGTVGLFSWDSAGVSFDNIVVEDLSAEDEVPGGEIVGTPGDDELLGTAGDDIILAGLGDDVVAAGAGDDVVEGGEGDDVLDGEDGNDVLKGGEGDDELTGGAGDDVLNGGEGDDVLDGGEGTDTADYSGDSAGVVVNLADGEAEGDDAGFDELSGIENVIGGSGDDELTGDDADNRLNGGLGNDVLHGGAGDDVLDGGEGNDELNGGEGDDIILAGLGNDVIDGGAGFDTLDLSAATGPVSVDFGAGRVSGTGIGTDTFANIEKLLFGAGDDTVTGGNGDDAFEGGAGNDTLKGGAGDDELWGGEGDDLVDGGSGDDALQGGLGDDVVKAGSGDDVVDGDDGDDEIDGGSGDDILVGGLGNDIILGGSGDDRIEGGAGDDVLSGGSGHDAFVFASGFGRDTITDFRTSGASSDVLEFGTDIFADFASALAAADQIGSDVVFTVDADNALTLQGVQLSSLAADDFRFV